MADALFHYNDSPEYGEAVTDYARRMQVDPRAFGGYYSWQVIFAKGRGKFLLPGRVPVSATRADSVATGAGPHGAYRRCNISELPSLSVKKAILQTPVSSSPLNCMPRSSSSRLVSGTSGTRRAIGEP